MAAMLFFAHDCDKTVVYYDDPSEAPEMKLRALPASATGKVGFVAEETLEELSRIAEEVPVICVSGARASTMKTRQSMFPMVSYWICENGGRVFKTSENGKEMIEDEDYVAYVRQLTTNEQWSALDSFARDLEQEGWKVDRNGYETMMRVSRGADMDEDSTKVEDLVPRIPDALTHTYNLGYLDVQVPGLGKMRSVKWLCNKIAAGKTSEYVFFGDDDNDVEAASESLEAFVANPRSEAMQSWIEDAGQRSERRRPLAITTPPAERKSHAGAVFLLQQVRAAIDRLKQEAADETRDQKDL